MTLTIRDPCWTKPAILAPGTELRIALEGAGDGSVEARLRKPGLDVPLAIGRRAARGGRRTWLTCLPAEAPPPGLYELALAGEGGEASVPNSVWVPPPPAQPLTFLHTSDLHLLTAGPHGAVRDRSKALEAIVAHVNAQRPAMVFDTGDLVSRYAGGADRILSADQADWQVRRAREILLGLQVPLFFTAGNHDVAFSWHRAAWARCAAAPWGRELVDYSFDFGGCHFAAMDASVLYDDVTLLANRNFFTCAQLDWLAADMARAAGAALRFLMCHYDYRRQLDGLLAELRIDAVFYGHSVRIPYQETRRPLLNGHLPADRAWRTVTVRDGGAESELGPTYQELIRGF